VRAQLSYHAQQRNLDLDIVVQGGTLASPVLCMGDPLRTRLAVTLELRDATRRPIHVGQVEDWYCLTDRQGNVHTLLPAGSPTYGTP
jgi:hypothetical protein